MSDEQMEKLEGNYGYKQRNGMKFEEVNLLFNIQILLRF